jgi:hypothetical protein
VKAGFAAARAGGRVAAKVGKAVAKPFKKGCNSFTPDTGVLMADGTTQPISDVEVGDVVAAKDPVAGELTAQPVLDVIVGFGDKHLIGVTTSRAPPAGEGSFSTGNDIWVATANHPIWVEGSDWTDADELEVGDVTVGVNGERRAITGVIDYGWLAEHTVYNLSVANVHTFMVGSIGAATLVHNSSPQCPIDWAKQNRHIPGTAEAAAAAKKFPRSMFFGAASAKKAIQMAVARGTPVKKRDGEMQRLVWNAGVVVGRGANGALRRTVTVIQTRRGWHGFPGSRP